MYCLKNNIPYTGKMRYKNLCTRKAMWEPGSFEDCILANYVSQGMSLRYVVTPINLYRESRGLKKLIIQQLEMPF